MDEGTGRMFAYVRAAVPGSGAHGFDHTGRVVRRCETIGAREGAAKMRFSRSFT